MKSNIHIKIVIDKLEYYLTKEIEKAVYFSLSDFSYFALYDWVFACIKARKQIGYTPIYNGLEDFLKDYKYDKGFINRFMSPFIHNKLIEYPYDVNYAEVILDIFENYLIREIHKSIYGGGNKCYKSLYNDVVECIEARKELQLFVNFNDVEKFLLYYKYPKNLLINSYLK